MLRRLRDLENWTVTSRDNAEVGTVEDLNFDDQRWTARYLVVNAGGWLVGNPVLISPMAIRTIDWEGSRMQLELSRDQVRNAPSPQLGAPVTRRFETDYAQYYGLPFYWAGPGIWGPNPVPPRLAGGTPGSEPLPLGTGGDPDSVHLHSVNEVSGYHIQALDGEIGHIEDFLFDDASWAIRYLVIDTSNWIGGRTVLLSPDWVRRVDWPEQLIHVDMNRASIKASPEYDPTVEVSRDYQDRLHSHYHRAGRRPG